MRCRLVLALLLLLLPSFVDAAPSVQEADFDTLLRTATLDSDTEGRRALAGAARAELHRRGLDTLAYLVSVAHLRNFWTGLFFDQVWHQVTPDQAAPILLKGLDSPHWRTRKTCVYYLGFDAKPQDPERVIKLLDDDRMVTATLRTLGKWHQTNAISRIATFLSSTNEIQRVRAVAAMKDIGSTNAVPHLLAALDDPIFTVRFKAVEALGVMGEAGARALRLRLAAAESPRSQRILLRALGEVAAPGAEPEVQRLLLSEDPLVRGDALRTLIRIEDAGFDLPPASETDPFVRSGYLHRSVVD